MHALYVEKKPQHRQVAHALLADLQETLALPQLTGLRILQRYLIDGITDDQFQQAIPLILSEPFTETAASDLPDAPHAF
ncbi:MAG: hypothetical protein AAGC74_14410, partial [Verrucomicrobiota bacterium]